MESKFFVLILTFVFISTGCLTTDTTSSDRQTGNSDIDIVFSRDPSWIKPGSSFYKYIYSDFDRPTKIKMANLWNTLVKNSEDNECPIIIAYRPMRPNSAGGIPVVLQFHNLSDKKVKYVYFDITPFNSVNDVTSCQVTGKSTVILQHEGFVDSGDRSDGKWENVWYNANIKTAIISKIRIVYDDNSEYSVEDQNIIDSLTIKRNEEEYKLSGLWLVD
jgi:hypothetical protein